MFSLLGFHLRLLRDWYEFEYRLDHLCHVALVCSFHLMSLACFLLRAFVFLSWLDTSFHFAVTYLMLGDMFIDHLFYVVHLSRTQYLILCLILDSTFDLMPIFSL